MKHTLGIIILACTIIVAVLLLSHTYKNRHRTNDVIQVTGLGKKDFKSDLVVWNGTFARQNFELKQAYALLQKDRENILEYLKSKGVKPSEIVFSSVNINKEFDYTYDSEGNQRSSFAGYRLNQQVEIESGELEKVENIAREITELINLGVEFYSNSPQYYYTGLSELKIEMIASATEDARIRAEKIAENAGAEIGDLRSAQMGIFQIIGQNSNEDFSWGGTFNTTSKMKTATITMRLEFGIE